MARHFNNNNQPGGDSDIGQLLQLAQLHNLTLNPQQEQQHLDSQDQAARMTAAIHLLGLMQEKEYQQGQLAHGDAALQAAIKEREMQAKTSTLDTLIAHGQLPPAVLAETLKNAGQGDYSNALATTADAEQAKKVALHLNNIAMLQKSGGKSAVDKYLPAIQADPGVWEKVKGQLPQDMTVPTPETPLGGKLGGLINTLRDFGGYTNTVPGAPLFGIPAYFGAKAGMDIAKKNPSLGSDFWAALMNQQPTQ